MSKDSDRNIIKKIGKAVRGLTFSLENKYAKCGEHYRYVIDKKENTVRIIPDETGRMTVSRKKSGSEWKPLFDIRSKEVRELVHDSDYMEIELPGKTIIVHCLKEAEENIISLKEVLEGRYVDINDILAKETGVFRLAVGAEAVSRPWKSHLYNDAYFDYLVSNVPERYRTPTMKKDTKKVYDVISLFSGAGLLDWQFKKDPRTNIVFAVDFDKDACETYKYNISPVIRCEDIRKIDGKDVPDGDIICGGPCCQAYSNSNRTNEDTEEGRAKRLLIEDYIRITKSVKNAKVFIIENVPQLLTKEEGLYIKKVFDGLGDYEITTAVVEDDKVGGFSKRKRCIVIGSKIGKITLPSVKLMTPKTVRDALKDVDASWYNWNDVTLPRKSTEETMKMVPQGGNWRNVPEEEWKNHGWRDGVTQSNIFRRLSWDEPSVTLTNWRKCTLTHPEENRILNVSEACAIMGLPKEFHVLGSSLNSRQQQVGNGVTQAISKFVKNTVLSFMDKALGVNTAVATA